MAYIQLECGQRRQVLIPLRLRQQRCKVSRDLRLVTCIHDKVDGRPCKRQSKSAAQCPTGPWYCDNVENSEPEKEAGHVQICTSCRCKFSWTQLCGTYVWTTQSMFCIGAAPCRLGYMLAKTHSCLTRCSHEDSRPSQSCESGA